jgi:hypothetical protein
MTRYLVSHRIKRIYESQDEIVNDWRGLRQRTHADARWVSSLYAAASERLYCEWEALSPEAIRACFLPVELEMAPIEKVEEVVAIDPAWLDEAGSAGAAANGGSAAPRRAPDRSS